MKIGIFGGSFNPPHKMHKNIALKLIEDKILDQIIYVPTGNKYNKPDLVNSEHRYNMLKLICNTKVLRVSNYELKSELTYTYQTLDYFKYLYQNDEIYFICGTDNLKKINTWKNCNYILTNYKILVIARDDDNINEIINDIKYKDNIIITNIFKEDISSTTIRNYIENKNYEDISNYLDKSVLDYIKKNELYKC